jgi:hypothetical protein
MCVSLLVLPGEGQEASDDAGTPKIRKECEESPACTPMKHHFEKCQEKVDAGEGYKGEDCVDEMCVSLLTSPTSDSLTRCRCTSIPARFVLTDVDPDLTFPSRDAYPVQYVSFQPPLLPPRAPLTPRVA